MGKNVRDRKGVARLYWESLPGEGAPGKLLALAGMAVACAGALGALYVAMWVCYYAGVKM